MFRKGFNYQADCFVTKKEETTGPFGSGLINETGTTEQCEIVSSGYLKIVQIQCCDQL